MQRISCLIRMLGRWGFVVLLLRTASYVLAQPPALRWSYEYCEGLAPRRIAGLAVLPGDEIIAYGGIRYDCSSFCGGFLAKVDSEGFQEWLHEYLFENGRELHFFNRCALIDAQRLVCVGRGYEESTTLSAFVAMINTEGDTLWISYFGYSPFDEANDVVVLDGAIYVSGRAYNPSSETEDWPIVAKYNFDGELLWQNFFTQSSTNYEVLLAHNDFSGLLALDCKALGQGSIAPLIYSVNEDGVFGVADTIRLGSDSRIYIHRFSSYLDQGFVIAGESTFQFSDSPLIVRFDNNLDTVWARSFDESWAGDRAFDLVVREDGSIVASLEYDIYYPEEDVRRYSAQFIRLDQAGDTLWSKLIGLTPEIDYLRGPVVSLSGGGYCFTSNLGLFNSHFSMSRSFPDTLTSDVPFHDDDPDMPRLLVISTFPNPFNSALSIALDVPLNQEVNVSLYDLLGQEVEVIYRGKMASNTISYAAPASLSSGVYFLRAAAGNSAVMRKVVLLK